MKLNSLKEMVEDYERVTGESVSFNGFIFDKDFHNADHVHFKHFPNVGFLFWAIGEHGGEMYFHMLQTYGKMAGMVDYIKQVMKLNDVIKIVTATTRNPKAHIRKWKMTRIVNRDYEYNGKHYYVLEGNIYGLR